MNDLGSFLFFSLALISILSALGVVLAKRLVYGVLLLTLTMAALSVLYLSLGAPFVAIVQILIYAGAILVLFLLVIMLLGVDGLDPRPRGRLRDRILSFLLIAAFGSELLLVLSKSNLTGFVGDAVSGTVESVGKILFQRYLLPFELVSAILLIGIVGVVVLSQKDRAKSES